MAKRRSMQRKASKRLFSKTAERVHPKNGMGSPAMRGGIRF